MCVFCFLCFLCPSPFSPIFSVCLRLPHPFTFNVIAILPYPTPRATVQMHLKPYLAYLMRGLAKLPSVDATVFRGVPASAVGVVREKYRKVIRGERVCVRVRERERESERENERGRVRDYVLHIEYFFLLSLSLFLFFPSLSFSSSDSPSLTQTGAANTLERIHEHQHRHQPCQALCAGPGRAALPHCDGQRTVCEGLQPVWE